MAAKTYETKIKLPTGQTQSVTVQADTSSIAKWMIESQYGKGSVIMSPIQVR